MTISFQEIPDALRVPGSFMEVDPSLAEVGAGTFPLRSLMIAPKGSGTLAVDTPQRITSAAQASALAGPGSIGSRMAAAWFAVNQATELDLILVTDSGTAREATIGFTGSSVIGNVAIYVGGDRYVVNTNQTAPLMATALEAAIDANVESAFSASVSASTVTLTAKNAGVQGDEIDLRTAFLDGEEIPSGISVTIAQTTVPSAGGADVTLALAAIAGVQYDLISHPFADATNLGLIETELLDRAGAMSAIPGHAFTGISGTQGALATLGDARNSPHSTIVGFESFPGVSYERAAAIAGQVARAGSNDPARPFQTLGLPGFAPAVSDRFTLTERNLLLFDGISTTVADRAGAVRIERLITTNQTNAADAPTESYLDVNLMLSLSFFRKSVVARIDSRFPRHMLAADGGIAPAPGVALCTPSVFMAEVVSLYQELIEANICEDLDGFIANSTAAIATGDPNRIDAALAPNFVNQLRISAMLVQFRR